MKRVKITEFYFFFGQYSKDKFSYTSAHLRTFRGSLLLLRRQRGNCNDIPALPPQGRTTPSLWETVAACGRLQGTCLTAPPLRLRSRPPTPLSQSPHLSAYPAASSLNFPLNFQLHLVLLSLFLSLITGIPTYFTLWIVSAAMHVW